MSSDKERVAGKLKRVNPNIISVHCIAHKLQLCVSQAAEKVNFLKEFQEMLTSMFYYFQKSAFQTEKLKAVQEVLNEPQLKYKEIHQVRWLSFYKALETLYLTWDSLVTYFEQEVENKRFKDGKLKGYINKLTQFEFVATIHMFMDVLPHVMELTLIFQKRDLDCSIVPPAIATCVNELTRYKLNQTTKPTYLKKFEEEVKFSDESSSTCQFKTHKLSASSQSRDRFPKIKEEFLDKLINNLNKRFPKETQDIITACSVLAMRPLSFVPRSDLQTWGVQELEVLLTHFDRNPADGDERFLDSEAARHEWSLVKHLVLQEKYPCDNMGTLWSIIYKFHKDLFPNLLKLAAVALTLPIHTADCERGFSLQNNLKNCQRNRLQAERLDTLMVISAEGPPLQEFPFERALIKWKGDKSRRIFSTSVVDRE